MAPGSREVSLGFMEDKFREGHHIIYIYHDDKERKETMVKFLQQGILENEKLLYLVDDISPDEMRTELINLGVDMEGPPNRFDITAGHHTLCPDHYFSREFMLATVADYYDNAIKQGFAGARGAGEMSWSLIEGRSTVPELLKYEAELNEILADHPLTTICQYDARRFDNALIMDMLSVHPMMIVRGQLVRNPCYVDPQVFLQEYEERTKGSATKLEP